MTKLEKKKAKYKSRQQKRTIAELSKFKKKLRQDNFKKRAEKRHEEMLKLAKEKQMQDILDKAIPSAAESEA